MKKIIFLIIIIAASFSAKCQTIDTTVTSITSVKIVPVKANFSDTANSVYLGVRIVSDNLKSECTVYWQLMYQSGTATMVGNATISGTDYTNWNGNNLYPFQFVASKYGLKFP
jgi:hypothetical protein